MLRLALFSHRSLPRAAVVMLAAFCASTVPAPTVAAPAEGAPPPDASRSVGAPSSVEASSIAAPPDLRGRLESRRETRDGESVEVFFVVVGEVEYVLELEASTRAELASMRREWVDVRGSVADDGDRKIARVASAADVAPQGDLDFEGFVVEPEEGDDAFSLRVGDRAWRVIDRRAGRKLKPFVGRNVVVRANAAFDGTRSLLDAVTKVVRKKLPGEREPRNEAQALQGAWKGVVDVTKLPEQITGAKIGKYPIEFQVGRKLAVESGRLLGTYDIVALAPRKLSMSRRDFRLELTYEIPGNRKYPVWLTGRFAADWKSAEGTFESDFLGTGTFDLEWSAAARARGGKPSAP